METNSESVSQFVGVTGVDTDRARFYLESAAWDLQVALASFYENGDDGSNSPEILYESDQPAIPPVVPVMGGSGGPNPPSGDEKNKGKQTSKPKTGKISTLANLLASESSSDEEEGQAFYAGGSERSGQQVIGPPRKKVNDIVTNMFKAAKEHGAEIVDMEDSVRSQSVPFRGAAYRLGASENDTQVIPGTSEATPQGQKETVLKMWRNGFSVDGGPLRDYDDSANNEFLESIRRGEIPRELIHEGRASEINLSIEDHRHLEYTASKPKLSAFSGAGQMLGSPVPKVVTNSASGNPAESEQTARNQIPVDDSQPTTNIQVRLADGSRIVVKLNHNQTVRDIYRFIQLARPQYANVNFTLMTTFPNKEVEESSSTLAEANLLNAVVVQRIK